MVTVKKFHLKANKLRHGEIVSLKISFLSYFMY